MSKAIEAGAGMLILDLEDSVPFQGKMQARNIIKDFLNNFSRMRPNITVRINSLLSGEADSDLNVITDRRLKGVVLPKTESDQDVIKLDRAISSREKEKNIQAGSIRIHALIETAKGIMNLKEIAGASPRLESLCFGSEDFTFDMGTSRTPEGNEILFARSFIAIVARAMGLLSFDTPYFKLSDHDGLERDSRTGRNLGYTGKMAIHPNQIDTVERTFTPTPQEIKTAENILSAYRETSSRGVGVAVINGFMVDQASAERARKLLASVNAEKEENR
jgi:citrate lyase beta subunit